MLSHSVMFPVLMVSRNNEFEAGIIEHQKQEGCNYASNVFRNIYIHETSDLITFNLMSLHRLSR
jgi:hypothetical protein